MTDTTSSSFFESMYSSAADGDPWNFAGSEYELHRYSRILAALGSGPYERALEPGCSVGVLTAQLAPLCGHVEACDLSPTAVRVAQERCAAFQNVDIRCDALRPGLPWHRFDLILLCEIGYYFTSVRWRTLVEEIVDGVQPGATVLASHWLGHSNDHLQSGDAVHEGMEHPLLALSLRERYTGFRIDRWTRL